MWTGNYPAEKEGIKEMTKVIAQTREAAVKKAGTDLIIFVGGRTYYVYENRAEFLKALTDFQNRCK
jgi:hypothetical protein